MVESKTKNKFIINKAFFGKTNCFKILVNAQKETYFHMGLLDEKTQKWDWKKVKISDIEIGEILHILKKEEGKCSFFHSYNDVKTQIWCNKSPKSFSIKINTVSKNLSIGEFEVLQLLLQRSVLLSNIGK